MKNLINVLCLILLVASLSLISCTTSDNNPPESRYTGCRSRNQQFCVLVNNRCVHCGQVFDI